ncbi:MAG TPA: tripartite tricarboxylate transporter substrate binding protein [Ramlibacter sp.]|jgi:tripartite-type tricarboxylate transporter receptor subunit TctC|nr:tripartite tricarboxylate transporter substrate binding protein [Ramlibacter sp.]
MRPAFPSRRHVHRFLLAAACAVLVPLTAQAQNFPNRPIRLVVTYPAGGSSDLMARIMGQKLSEHWGQPVVIESKPGAAGSIGMEYTARQPADGYTFVVGNLGPVAVNPLISKVPYSMEKDFIPVALTATGANILVVPANSPYKSLQDIITAARAKPGSLSFGTSGPGSMAHLGGEMIMRQAKVKMNGVNYKGGGQAVNDLLAGHIDMMVADALPVSQHIKVNRLRPIAITSGKRSRTFPDVPTFSEAGLPGIVAENWWGVFLPAGTPKPIVDSYHSALVKIMADADLKAKFADLGVEAQASTQDEFRAFLAAEISKYARLVADNGIKGE